MRRTLLGLTLVGALAAAVGACVGDDPFIQLGALEDAGDDPGNPPGSPDATSQPGQPDAMTQPGQPDAALPPKDETLTVQFDTTSNGGQYSPKNIVAVWIEDSSGNFQKTVGRWAGTRKSHLVAWIGKAGSGDVDSVSGATRSNHNNRLTVTWNFKNKQGQAVPDGTYTIRMELADSNTFLAQQNHQGTFTINKNGTASMQNTSGGGFNNVAITYSGR